eukprot:224349-Amorphochlora_amoeboformis.AAC.2
MFSWWQAAERRAYGEYQQVWLAAHMQKKLTKNFVIDIDIVDSVQTLLDPHTPLALRLSGQLLLGLVHIHSRKARYLQDDCNSARASIRVVFSSRAAIDLPDRKKKKQGGAEHVVEMEEFDELDFDIEDYSLQDLDLLKINVARDIDITQDTKSDTDIEMPRKNKKPENDDFDIPLVGDGGAEDLLNFDNPPETSFAEGPSSMLNFDDPNIDDPNNLEMPLADDLGLDIEGHAGARAGPLNDEDAREAQADAEKALEEAIKEGEQDAKDEDPDLQPKKKRQKKKRVLALDETVEISKVQMRKQIQDSSKLRCKRKRDPLVVQPKNARQRTSVTTFPIFMADQLPQGLVDQIVKKIKASIKERNKENADPGTEVPEQLPLEEQQLDDNLDNLKNHELLDPEFPNDLDISLGVGLDSTIGVGANSSFADVEHTLADHKHGEERSAVGQLENELDAEPDRDDSGERKAADRLAKMYHFLDNKMDNRDEISFRNLVGRASRKAAAGVFHGKSSHFRMYVKRKY